MSDCFDCKNLKAEDITPWHSDVFDHPQYKYTCALTCKEVNPRIHCRKCKNFAEEYKES